MPPPLHPTPRAPVQQVTVAAQAAMDAIDSGLISPRSTDLFLAALVLDTDPTFKAFVDYFIARALEQLTAGL